MAERILRQPEIERRTGLSRTTIWRLERSGDFPPRRRVLSNTIGWLESEVDEWIQTRPAATTSDAGEAVR
jgi:prophage regulatory protein